jgi:tetratricopeptide (TPR) repeat protein
VPGYEVLDVLGCGGMGVVYRARQLGLDRLVALKMILHNRTSEDDLARFQAEAEAVAALRHPNIIQIYEIGKYQQQPFFSLEFADGGSLDRLLRGRPQPAREVALLIQTLALAADHAHTEGIIHRDLKPGNILLQRKSEFRPDRSASALGVRLSAFIPKVTDFGLAKRIDDELVRTGTGILMGTPGYIAPEQAGGWRAYVGPWTDVWALGVILYECLTGRPPFKGETVWQTVSLVCDREPVAPSQLVAGCPRDLETICLKCLRKRPADRYPTARLLAEDLQRFLEDRPIQARAVGRVERLLKWTRRAPLQAAGVVASLGFLVALTVALFAQVQSDRKDAELRKHELEERERQASLETRITEHFSRAEQAAALAAAGDVAAWTAIERDARAAELLEAELARADFPLHEPIRRLLGRAEGLLADARVRTEHWELLKGLKEHHGDAVFFGALSTGLELQDNLDRARRAAAAGLALFRITPDNEGPPVVDVRFFSPEEIRQITALCYELLLIEAEALAQPLHGEPVDARQGRLYQALKRLDRADHLQPGLRTSSGLTRRAEYLAALKRNNEAEAARQAAARTPPTLAADHFLAGMAHCRRGRFREAIRPLAEALRQQPGHYGAEYLLAVCRLKEGRFQDAKLGLTRCLEQRPSFLWPRLLRGYAEMELEDFQAARTDFDAVLARPPDETATYVALVDRGVLAMRRRDWDAAVADLKRAVGQMPDALPAYLNLALTCRQRAEPLPGLARLLPAPGSEFVSLFFTGRQRQARQEAVAVLDGALKNKALRRKPETGRLYHERGRLLADLNEWRRAGEDFSRAVALATVTGLGSTLAEDLLELGRVQHRLNEFDKAINAYEALLRLANEVATPEQRALAHRFLADSLFALGNYEKAGKALDRYLETVPLVVPGRVPSVEETRRLANAFEMRGALRRQQKEYRAAIDDYTHSLRLVHDPQILAQRGWAYLALGAPSVAALDFDEAVRLQPDFGDALLGRGDARVRLGEVSKGLDDAKQGLKIGPRTRRMLYNGACVNARAAFQLAAGSGRPDARVAFCEERALALLRETLTLLERTERAAFWRDVILVDRVFDQLRQSRGWSELEADFAPK